MSIQGFPSSQKVPLGTGITNNFATVVPTDPYRNSLDVTKSAFRVGSATIPRTAGAATGIITVDGQNLFWVADTSTPARAGDFVRFETGVAQYIEIPIVKVETNRFLLSINSGLLPSSSDTFYILRYATPQIDSSGNASVTVAPSPIAFIKNGSNQQVIEDTATPANSRPLPTKVLNNSGNAVDFATEATLGFVNINTENSAIYLGEAASGVNPFKVTSTQLDNLLSTTNSTTTNLGSNGVFTGTGVDALQYGMVQIFVRASHDSSALGLVFQASHDNTNWYDTDAYNYLANSVKTYSLTPPARYFRIKFTNGAVAQSSFTLQTILKKQYTKPSSHRVGDVVTQDDDAEIVQSTIIGKTTAGGGSYVDVKVNPSGALTVDATVTSTVGLTDTQLRATPVPVLEKIQKYDGTVVTPYATDGGSASVGNFLQKFRDGFVNAQPDLTKWDEYWVSQGTGFINAGGNSAGSAYMRVSMCPFTPGSEYQLVSKNSFNFPVRFAYGLSVSQRFFGVEIEASLVGADGAGVVETITPVADLTISGTISVTTNVATINFASAHNLNGGDRVILVGNADSRMNLGPAIVTIVTATQITIPLTIANGTYTAGGVVRTADPLIYAKNAVSLLYENSTTTNASFVARRNGAKFRTLTTTVASTSATQPNTSPYTDSFVSAGDTEIIGNMEEVLFSSRSSDSLGTPSGSGRYSQGIPDEENQYKIRIRVKNLDNITIPVAKIVSIAKTGTTTATVTTDVAHGLTTSDYVQVYGVRDQTNFPNLTTQTVVSSIVSPTQFTVIIGTATTSSSAGGSVFKIQGSVTAPGISSIVVQSISRTNNVMTLIGSGTWTGLLPGDTIQLHGCDATSMGLYDGSYKVLRTTTTTLEVESVGANFGSINCGGAIFKRTDLRLAYVRIADYTRHAVEISNARGGTDSAKAMTVNGLVTLSSTSSVTAIAGLPGIVADVASAAITTTATTSAITPTAGTSYSINIPVTAATGTNQTMDVGVEESDDSGTNWYRVYDFPRITTAGMYRSPQLRFRGNRIRYVQTIGGTSPSFTRTVNRMQASVPGEDLVSFVDRSIVLNTLNSTSPTYYIESKEDLNIVVRTTAQTTRAVIAVEFSDDSSNWYVGGTITTKLGYVLTKMVVGQFKFMRLRVATAGTGITLDNISIKSNGETSLSVAPLGGRNGTENIYYDYVASPVTSASYVQLVASTIADVNKVEIFDSSGEVIILAVGAAASEVEQLLIFPGGNGSVDLYIPYGSRISIKAKNTTANSGFLAINLYS